MKRYAIEILEIEHANILRMTQVMRRMALRMMEEKTLFVDDIRLVIDWIRGYADKHHHGKEEVILFDEMVKELGDVVNASFAAPCTLSTTLADIT